MRKKVIAELSASTSSKEGKLEQIIQSIKDITRFEYYYVQNTCFRGKVNSLYKKYLVRKYEVKGSDRAKKKAESIEGSDVRLLAPVAVHNNYLSEAQSALRQCLLANEAALSNDENKNIDFGNLNTKDTPDPDTPFISPFDRRLDRLVIGEEIYGIIPISTKYAQSGTIGYTVSESFIKDSTAEEKNQLITTVRRDINMMQNDDFYVGVPALMNNYAYER